MMCRPEGLHLIETVYGDTDMEDDLIDQRPIAGSTADN